MKGACFDCFRIPREETNVWAMFLDAEKGKITLTPSKALR